MTKTPRCRTGATPLAQAALMRASVGNFPVSAAVGFAGAAGSTGGGGSVATALAAGGGGDACGADSDVLPLQAMTKSDSEIVIGMTFMHENLPVRDGAVQGLFFDRSNMLKLQRFYMHLGALTARFTGKNGRVWILLRAGAHRGLGPEQTGV